MAPYHTDSEDIMSMLIQGLEWLSIELRHVWREGECNYVWKLYNTVSNTKEIPLSILNLKIIISLKPVGIRIVVGEETITDGLGYRVTSLTKVTKLASKLTVTMAVA